MFNPEQFNPANPKKPEEIKPEEQDQNQEQEQERREEMFRDTADFDKRAAENPAVAESWMREVFKSDERYRGNEKWLEDRQRVLLEIYCQQGNKENAQRMIEETEEPHSQAGRIKKFERFFGEYTGKKLEVTYNAEKTDMPITNSMTFKQALRERRFEEAEAWLNNPVTIAQYKDNPSVLEDRRKEFEEAKKIVRKEV